MQWETCNDGRKFKNVRLPGVNTYIYFQICVRHCKLPSMAFFKNGKYVPDCKKPHILLNTRNLHQEDQSCDFSQMYHKISVAHSTLIIVRNIHKNVWGINWGDI